MNAMKSIRWAISLSMLAGGLIATSAQAKPPGSFSSFSDITGTNIWNNVAPIFEGSGTFDPELIEDIERVNREGQSAFNACSAALAQIEQNIPSTRRFARQPSNQTVEVPMACRQLEQLRTEANNLRATVEEARSRISRSEFATW
jgi:hypothetical protein